MIYSESNNYILLDINTTYLDKEILVNNTNRVIV
jgi:hypothetical protein